MSSLKDVVTEQKERLVVEAGKAMAKKAIDDLTLSPEARAARDAEASALRSKQIVKLVLGGVVAVFVVVVGLRLAFALWKLFLLVGIVGAVGAGAWFTFKPQLTAWQQRRLAERNARELERTASARAEAEANTARAAQQKLDDELARLKRQL
jgi:hypothetical protein